MSRALLKQALDAMSPLQDLIVLRQACDAIRAELAKPEPEPVAWMWQHTETGRTGFVDIPQIEDGRWERGNPRLKLITPLYFAAGAKEKIK